MSDMSPMGAYAYAVLINWDISNETGTSTLISNYFGHVRLRGRGGEISGISVHVWI